jgi:hypothetical protein
MKINKPKLCLLIASVGVSFNAFALSPIESTYPSMSMPGIHDGWTPGATPMQLVEPFTWELTTTLSSQAEFKFTPFSDWNINFGANGVEGGDNILVEDSGEYRIRFNDSSLAIDISKVLSGAKYSSMSVTGTHNSWTPGAHPMTLQDDAVWQTNVTFDHDNAEIKFTPFFDWSVSFGLNCGDSNIVMSEGAGEYQIRFDDNACQYTITKLTGPTSKYPSMSIAGTHNDWTPGATPMALNDDGIWETTLDFAIDAEIKFTPYTNWDISFGLDCGDANIAITEGAGTYQVLFDDHACHYQLIKHEPEACSTQNELVAGKQQIRLLTQQEYNRIMRDLFMLDSDVIDMENIASDSTLYNNSADIDLELAYIEALYNAADEVVSQLDIIGNTVVLNPEFLPLSSNNETLEPTVATIARTLFHRPLSEEERQFYLTTEPALALKAILTSPHFLYRSEIGVVGPDGFAQLTNEEIANFIAFTFGGTLPDRNMWLNMPLLQDPSIRADLALRYTEQYGHRDQSGVNSFHSQWLGYAYHQPELHSAEYNALMGDMQNETAALTHSTFMFPIESRVKNLLLNQQSEASPALADYYGLANNNGAHQTIQYQGHRSGIFGHASVLGYQPGTGMADPMARARMIRENLLCQTTQEFYDPILDQLQQDLPHSFMIPLPCPDGAICPTVMVDSDDPQKQRDWIKEQLDTLWPFLGSDVLAYIQPGFGLNQLDRNGLVNPLGETASQGTIGNHSFTDAPSLASALADGDEFTGCYVRQFYRYARGYQESQQDQCQLEKLTNAMKANHVFWQEWASSPEFTLRRP